MPDKPDQKSKDNPPVKLFRRGQLLEITPRVDGLVEQFLSVQHVGRATAKNGFVVEQRQFPLVWPGEDKFGHPYHQTFAGLESEIERLLHKMGRKCVLTGDRPSPLPEPLWKSLPRKRTGDRRLLRFVHTSERGIISYREGKVDVAWLIAQIALAYPDERIVVLATRNRDAQVLYQRIRKLLGAVSLATTKHHPAQAERVVVATRSGIKQSGVRIEQRTLCISVNPTEILNPDKRVSLKRLRKVFEPEDAQDLHKWSEESGGNPWLPVVKARLYGLVSEDLVLAPQQRDLLTAMFGQSRLFIPKHGCRELPVHVTTWPFNGGNKLSVDATTLEIKRTLVWKNGPRNRLIAGLGKAITESNDKALATKYSSIAKDLYAKLGRRVAILVENVEHAAQLHQRLPDWPIVAGKVDDTTNLKPKMKDAIEAGEQPTARKSDDVIVTTQGFAKLGTVEVLIRADAGTGLPPISSEYFVAGDLVPASLTIVDVKDHHHPHLRRRAKWRGIAYQERGWKVDGVDRLSTHGDFADYAPVCLHPDRPSVTSVSYLHRRKGDPKTRTGKDAYVQRFRRRKRNSLLAKGHITLTLIADPEFLLQCFKKLRSEGGWGAGMDNVSFASLSPSEWANVFRQLSKALLKSRYRPLEARKVPIPKPGTLEKRILSLRSICDRVVAKDLHSLLEPHLDTLFLDGSWGFRKGRGTLEMLVRLKRTIEETGRTIVVIDDVRKAFDKIRISDLLKTHGKAQKELAKQKDQSPVKINDSVIKLIAVMAQDTNQSRSIGIDQGNNYSPTALNVLLHYVHDLPITSAAHFPFWFRYADNLVYLCQDESEGQQVRQQVQHLLNQSKLELKGKGGGIFDLQKNSATLLGFGMQMKDDEVSFTLTEQAWNNLKLQLAESHNALNPSEIALEVITGWVNAFGMAFEDDGSDVAKVLQVAAQYGFREVDRERVEKVAGEAKARWEKMIEHESA